MRTLSKVVTFKKYSDLCRAYARRILNKNSGNDTLNPVLEVTHERTHDPRFKTRNHYSTVFKPD